MSKTFYVFMVLFTYFSYISEIVQPRSKPFCLQQTSHIDLKRFRSPHESIKMF